MLQMDRQLYFACREDRERFCHDVQAGEGKIFQCLMDHKDDKDMNPEVSAMISHDEHARSAFQCGKMLSTRAGLMGSNYHLAQPLLKQCTKELNAHHCLPQVGFERSLNFHLSWVLLCLENGRHRYQQQQHERKQAELEKKPVEQTAELIAFSPECEHEMIQHRKMMTEVCIY